MTDKIGSLIIDLKEALLLPEEKELLAHPLVGGVILFKRNYQSYQQLKNLCRSIRVSRKQSLLIMVDQEGGRVQRFLNEFTPLPEMAMFGKLSDNNPKLACLLARECAWLMAHELLTADIDLSLAPVLDLNKGISSVIGNRAFHSHPSIVAQLANEFIQGMREAGMATTGKHFPGHGSIILDSHIAMAIDNRSLKTIEQEDMLPFANMIKAGITAIMASHIIFTQVDALSVGFSHFWLKEILRSRLQFKGPILTDDLNMEGANISMNYSDRVIAARGAGCDFTLLCNNHKGVVQVLDRLPHRHHMIEKDKWMLLRSNFSPVNGLLAENKRWIKARELLANVINLN